MKKSKILSISIIAALACVLFGVAGQKQSADKEINALGKTALNSSLVAEKYMDVNDYYLQTILKEGINQAERKALSDAADTFEIGKNIAISRKEIQQYQDYYQTAGMDQKSAYQEAVRTAEERNALYVAAIQNGYEVTDQEIYEWLNELRGMLEQDDTGVYEAALKGFESEEAYWRHEFEVYRISLPIQNYIADKQKEFCSNYQKANVKTEGDDPAAESEDAYNDWSNGLEDLKEKLVKEQMFQKAKGSDCK